jgi:hypothetical protein
VEKTIIPKPTTGEFNPAIERVENRKQHFGCAIRVRGSGEWMKWRPDNRRVMRGERDNKRDAAAPNYCHCARRAAASGICVSFSFNLVGADKKRWEREGYFLFSHTEKGNAASAHTGKQMEYERECDCALQRLLLGKWSLEFSVLNYCLLPGCIEKLLKCEVVKRKERGLHYLPRVFGCGCQRVIIVKNNQWIVYLWWQ